MNQNMEQTKIQLGSFSTDIPRPAKQIIKLDDDSWLVLFQWEGLKDENYARNLWRFDRSGNLMWKVQSGPTTSMGLSPWAYVQYIDIDEAWELQTADSIFYRLDIETGKTEFLFNSK